MEKKSLVMVGGRAVAYYRLGPLMAPKLVLIHGNASSSAFFFPTLYRLAERFDVVAPDLNGFGDTEAMPVKSPTALHDWAEDIDAMADALLLKRFALLGWSLGGGVALQYAISHPKRLSHLILLSPMSPYGFGGTRGLEGKMYDERGWGSPGGFANPAFIDKLKEQDRGDDPMAARAVLEKSLFKDGWPVEKPWQDLYVDELLKIRLGKDYYPGDHQQIPEFPYVLPGTRGISNALAPQYAKLEAITDIDPKPPVLWIRGAHDSLASDKSFSDLATLGMMGALPGYPGEDVFPPQPMVGQTREVLQKYAENGGHFREAVMENSAHASHLEQPEEFVEEMFSFLEK